MAKIIDINETIISIGTDNGSIKEVRTCDINFVPHIGDEVEIFETETKTIVSKIEAKPAVEVPTGGININVQNTAANAAPAAQAVVSANGSKAVSKVTYCVLAFLLGGLGVHKFYVGKIGTGILFLLFCWTYIPAFIALIEFIVALCKPADANGMILV